MRNSILFLSLTLTSGMLAMMPLSCLALDSGEETDQTTPWYENEESVPYPDNTQALQSATDNAVDILHGTSKDNQLALQGEIMLKVREDITEIYSNGNLVEQIVKGVGSTGVVTTTESEGVKFTPTGRPELLCPSKELGWFGPCRVEQSEGASNL